MTSFSVRFLKSLAGPDPILDDGTPQIAFIGRSNVGKSSLINSLTGQKGLARTSSFPGRTQNINVFEVSSRNRRQYWLDLPGYGYSRHSLETKRRLHGLIDGYLFQWPSRQKWVVLIIDAEVGPSENDWETFRGLQETGKPILIVANKVDKIRKTKAAARLRELQGLFGHHKIIPYSSESEIGRRELAAEIFATAE